MNSYHATPRLSACQRKRWIPQEPQIVDTYPALGLQVAAALSEIKRYKESEVVLSALDKFPIETLAGFFPDTEKGTWAVNDLRVSVRRNLCFSLMPAKALDAFRWIEKEPGIIQADPRLALAVLASLVWELRRYKEAHLILSGLDNIPDDTIAGLYPRPQAAIDGLNEMRVEVSKTLRFKTLPPRWDMTPGSVRDHMAIVEDGLQRRVGLGQADTLVNLSLLAVSGDRGAIPLFVRALSHHKRDIQREGALGLYLHGDPRGLRWLMSEDPHEGVSWTLRLLKDPTAEKRVAEWDRDQAFQHPSSPAEPSKSSRRQDKPEKRGFLSSFFGN